VGERLRGRWRHSSRLRQRPATFEHDVMFWESFLELVRVLRPGGLLYLNAPSNTAFHRYPLDC